MKRFTIYLRGTVMGTYSGKTDADALNALAVEKGFADFGAWSKAAHFTRDDFKVPEVTEASS